MAYAEGGLGPFIGEHACSLLVTLFVANLRCHSNARYGRQLDQLVAVDLICGQHSVVLLAMIGGSGDGRQIGRSHVKRCGHGATRCVRVPRFLSGLRACLEVLCPAYVIGV